MIKQESIDLVRSRMDIYEVLGKFITIKRNMACCPFHGEKTPSFHIWKNKQVYKCFGCGKGGDAIRFVMEHERKTFVEAIEFIAGIYQIELEQDKATPVETEEKKNAKGEQFSLVKWAHEKYEEVLRKLPDDSAAVTYMHSRGFTRERMQEWSMGYAPDDWKYLTTPCINMGKHAPGVDCGLIYTREGQNWDFFRNRIIVPIHDQNGVLVGLAGRYVPTGKEEEDKRAAKWMNPCESLVYSKAKVWYGLWQAQKSIRQEGFAYVVEGYMDVQSMHDSDLCNTVASSGTEIDDMQIKLLKRYTDHVVLCYDGDEPGIKKAMKQVNAFLKQDFKVSMILLPDAMDPDEFILHQNQLIKNEKATQRNHPGGDTTKVEANTEIRA